MSLRAIAPAIPFLFCWTGEMLIRFRKRYRDAEQWRKEHPD